MDRFKRRYTEEQRRAVVDAIVLDNMTAPAAVEAATHGRLGLRAFSMPVTTARHLASQERKRHRAADPAEWMRSELVRAKEKLEQAGRELYREDSPDPGRIARHAKAVAQVGNSLLELERRSTTPPGPSGSDGDGEAETQGLLARLVESMPEPEPEEPSLT